MSSVKDATFSTRQTASAVGLTARQIQHMAVSDIVSPEIGSTGTGRPRKYGYFDIVSLVVAKSLIDAGIDVSIDNQKALDILHFFNNKKVSDKSLTLLATSVEVKVVNTDELLGAINNISKTSDSEIVTIVNIEEVLNIADSIYTKLLALSNIQQAPPLEL